MPTLEEGITSLAEAIGADIKAINQDIVDLQNTPPGSVDLSGVKAFAVAMAVALGG